MSKQTRNHLHFLELHSLLMREIHFIIFNFILFNNNNNNNNNNYNKNYNKIKNNSLKKLKYFS